MDQHQVKQDQTQPEDLPLGSELLEEFSGFGAVDALDAIYAARKEDGSGGRNGGCCSFGCVS